MRNSSCEKRWEIVGESRGILGKAGEALNVSFPLYSHGICKLFKVFYRVPLDGFQDRHVRPLRHPSAFVFCFSSGYLPHAIVGTD
jgi:hypothetical protein